MTTKVKISENLSKKAQTILTETKEGSIAAADINLAGLVNYARFAQEFFGKDYSWFNAKVRANSLFDKSNGFTDEEIQTLVKGLRELAVKLTTFADAIDSAPRFDNTKEEELPEE